MTTWGTWTFMYVRHPVGWRFLYLQLLAFPLYLTRIIWLFPPAPKYPTCSTCALLLYHSAFSPCASSFGISSSCYVEWRSISQAVSLVLFVIFLVFPISLYIYIGYLILRYSWPIFCFCFLHTLGIRFSVESDSFGFSPFGHRWSVQFGFWLN